MRAASFHQLLSGTASQNAGATGIVERTAQISRVCPAREQQFPLRGWRVGATLAITREAIAQWRQRVWGHNKPSAVNDGDVRDIRRIRVDVEVERCKAFWWV